MGNRLKKIRAGDPLRVSAETYNAFVDAAQSHIDKQFGNSSRSLESLFSRSATTVLVKNASGFDAPRFGILGIDKPVIAPSVNQIEFLNRVVLSCIVPSGLVHNSKFVITMEPIPKGSFGMAWISGVCPVYLNVSDVDHEHAEIESTLMTALKSSEEGIAQILWKESGTGTKWAVVRFGGTGGGGGSAIQQFRVTESPFVTFKDTVKAELWNGTSATGEPVHIARAPLLRLSGLVSPGYIRNGVRYELIAGISTSVIRVIQMFSPFLRELWAILPQFVTGDILYAASVPGVLNIEAEGTEVTFLDLNVDNRSWVLLPGPTITASKLGAFGIAS